MDIQKHYTEASIKTADNLRTIAHSLTLRELSQLSLPEIDAVVEAVAQVIPAGNVPGVILSGLARLTGRKPPKEVIKRDIDLLFKGIEQVLDKAAYLTVFAGPAAVIWGYQNLLKLAGKEPDDAFPEGTWQFYVDYALREDTARHANETYGFDTALNRHQMHLSVVDRITAWTMAAIHCLHQYDELLKNEWCERTYTYLLREITSGANLDESDAVRYTRLYGDWTKRRPYSRGPDAAAQDTYPTYRRIQFDRFLEKALRGLAENHANLYRRWNKRVRVAEKQDLPAYQRQMSILAYLEPSAYGETRTPISLKRAHIGVIHRGRYYLIPTCAPGTDQPADVAVVRAQVVAIVKANASSDLPQACLVALAQTKRTALPGLRDEMSETIVREWDALRLAPILLNSDPRPRHLPLSELRQAERGVGDHALTIFDTGETYVFDQSHIFFDGAWGSALAEILTNEALAWAVYLNTLPPAQPAETRPPALGFQFRQRELDQIRQAPRVTTEVGVETEVLNVKPILSLRKRFKQRSDLLRLTVNDLLILYRAIHAAIYRPAPDLLARLQNLARESATRLAARTTLEEIEQSGQVNPAILIPVDASQRSPRDRLYPMSFEVPLADLDLLTLHARTVAALDAYENATGDRTAAYETFNQLQREYLATLAGFGDVLSKAKEIALLGESTGVGTIKLLAHMPTPLQRLLDQIPGHFDVLNDIIKGREVFSNVGAVVPTSTLTRFITAKDDNEKKTLAWGVITDATGNMRVTLRDFRPHVRLLAAAGQKETAAQVAQDYVDSYAHGVNRFVADVRRIVLASRETRSQTGEK
ncbi:MAG: hypothetical protein GY832_22555 [Chloroflexi bacterium]|nr:hypothetical protein [Chloroflexota bacterium]